MKPQIPGYYYDEGKNRYFKIEASQTAPASASWSSNVVKQRKDEHEAADKARQRSRLIRHHVGRHAIAQNVVSSGLLAREMGLQPTAEFGRGGLQLGDVGASAWATGLVAKGCVPFEPLPGVESPANMPYFYLNMDDQKTGLGTAYACLGGDTLVGSYIPTDANESIHFSADAGIESGRTLAFRREIVPVPQLSSIEYHADSHSVLMTSRQEEDGRCGLYAIRPPRSDEDSQQPYWLLGEVNDCDRILFAPNRPSHIYGCSPAPPGSQFICILGTNWGVLGISKQPGQELVVPLTPDGATTRLPQPLDTFTQDFQYSHPMVVLLGGRSPYVWRTDIRAPAMEWDRFPYKSSIAHLRTVNEHQVLVAGLRSCMGLYDMRYFVPNNKKHDRSTRPLLSFPEYRNEAHYHVGWDVCPELNLVAAAHDDGTVKLFSLASGRQLRCSALDAIRTDSPIKALKFEKMPRERMSSLFVGEGPNLRKFSFGTENLDDEA